MKSKHKELNDYHRNDKLFGYVHNYYSKRTNRFVFWIFGEEKSSNEYI